MSVGYRLYSKSTRRRAGAVNQFPICKGGLLTTTKNCDLEQLRIQLELAAYPKSSLGEKVSLASSSKAQVINQQILKWQFKELSGV